jgi:Ni/Co efflux regulator RcnB
MKLSKWMGGFAAALFALSMIAAPEAAQGRNHAKEKKVEKKVHNERKVEKHEYRYSQHDRDQVRVWYREHENNLPPGLAKRDRLPPGLEKQLRVRGTLPPGLRDHFYPAPEEFVERLPPPPPDCQHVLIGGSLVLLNRKTFLILDIYHLFR